MVLHLSHTEGGFGVPFNRVTKDLDFYTTVSCFVSWMGSFSQTRQELWLPKDDLRDSSSWSSPPLMLLRDIHSKLIDQYDWKEVCETSPSLRILIHGTRALPPLLVFKVTQEILLHFIHRLLLFIINQ
jgi:hypothetical protein